MSTSIDEKVVQLTLDNKQFTKASDETMSGLEKLKKLLRFEDASKGFEEVERGIKKVDFSPMTNGIQTVSYQFNALATVADAALRNITNNVIASSERMIKSLSIDQVTSGWGKYAEKTSSVQTIMAATAQQFENTDVQMAKVNEQLEKLTWFTDETSHKFNDMVSGIGKFTANNVKLETSVKAMEGIATWASVSGATAEQASHAIYNLSQAIATGSVKVIDWSSIETANMATAEFKQTAMETAYELGKLQKTSEGLFKTLDGKAVSIENFREQLSKGWLTSEVLLGTLEKYGGFADELNKFVEETGILTATAMNYIDDYVNGTLDMTEATKATGLSVEELLPWLEKLGAEEYKLGRKAFRASQETKTFQEAIDYIKEAVSSGWSTSFEYIFGDYLEAKEWWSEIAESMYDVFVVGGEIRNQTLSLWKESGGRELFLDGIRNIIEAVKDVIGVFKGAWAAIFPDDIEKRANWLLTLTAKFRDFTANMRLTTEGAEDLKTALSGIFNFFKTVATVAKRFFEAISPIAHALNLIAGAIVHIMAVASSKSITGSNSFLNSKNLNDLFVSLNNVATIIATTMIRAFETLYIIGSKVSGVLETIFSIFKVNGGGLAGFISSIGMGLEQAFTTIKNGGNANGYTSFLGSLLGITGNVFRTLSAFVTNFLDSLVTAEGETNRIFNAVGSTVGVVVRAITNVISSLTVDDVKAIGIVAALGWLSLNLGNLLRSITGITDTVKEITKQFKRNVTFGNIIDQLNSLADKTMILQIGISIALLVSSLNTLANLDAAHLGAAILTLGVISVGMLKVMKKINEILKEAPPGKMVLFGVAMTEMSIAFRILASSVTTMARFNPLQLVSSVAALGASLAIVYQFINSMTAVDTKAMLIAATSISAIAVGIGLLTPSILMLSLIDPLNMLTAVGAFASLLTVIQIFVSSLTNLDAKSILATAAAVNILSLGLISISAATISLGNMSLDQAVIGLVSMAAILGSLALTMMAFSKFDPANVAKASIGIGALSGSIKIIASSVSMLGQLNENSFKQALEALVTMSGVVTAVIAVLSTLSNGVEPKSMMSMVASLVSVSAALIGFAAAMKLMQGVSWGTVGKGLVVFGAALAGVLAAAYAIKMLNLGPSLATLSATILSFSLNLVVVSASIWLIINAMKELATGIVALSVMAATFGDDFPKMIEAGIASLTQIFRGILLMIVELGPEIAMAIATIIGSIQAAIWLSKHKVTATVLTVGVAVIEALSQLAEPLIQALIHIIQVLNDNLPRLMVELGYFVGNLIAGVIDLIVVAVATLIANILDRIGFDSWADKIREWTGETAESAMQSAADGIDKGRKELESSVDDAAQGAVDTLNDTLGNDANGHSEEGEKAAKAVTKTFINEFGTEEVLVGAKDAADELGTTATDSLNDAVEEGGDKVTSTVETVATEHANTYGQTVATEAEKQDDVMAAGIQSAWNSANGKVDFSIAGLAGITGLFGGTSENKKELSELERYSKEAAFNKQSLYEYLFAQDEVSRELLNKALAQGKITAKEYQILRKEQGYYGTKSMNELGQSAGESLDEGVGSGIGGSTASQSAAKEKVNTIADTFKSEISKIDFTEEGAELNYKLWQAMNPDASEAEKLKMEAQYTADQLKYQGDRMAAAESYYNDMVKQYGETSEEAMKAEHEFLQHQIKYYELQNKLAETRQGSVENTEQAFRAASAWMNERGEDGLSNYEFLIKQGFKPEDIYRNALEQQGLNAENYIAKKTADTVKNGMSKGFSEEPQLPPEETAALSGYVADKAVSAIEGAEPEIQTAAAELSDAVSNTVIEETSDGLNFGLGTVRAKAVADSNSIGKDVGQGVADGEESKKRTINNMSTGIIKEDVIGSMKEEAEIASPSKKTYYIGQMLGEGLAQGFESMRTRVLSVVIKIIQECLQRAKEAAGTHSPSTETEWIGQMMDLGLVKGMDGYANKVYASATGMMDNLSKTMHSELANQTEETNRYLKDAFGLDDNELSMRVVVDLDDKDARNKMSELERLYSARATGSMYGSVAATSGINQNRSDLLLHSIEQGERYRADTLQNLYNLVDSYFTESKMQSATPTVTQQQSSEPANISFTQNNYSPKTIGRVETYRNTKRQFTAFANKLQSAKR